MAMKIMLFIDGSWLYQNTPRLRESYGDPGFHLDFGKLPLVLAQEIGAKLGKADLDVVRTYLFGSYPEKYDPIDEELAANQRDFFDMLKEDYHYEVEIFPINFMGKRLKNRDPNDTFMPKEKCVDIALAAMMLYLAAIPNAYDIAIAVVGDRDFKPMLQNVRRLGKRVAIASIKNSCAPEFADPKDAERVKDFDIIWLNDLLHKLELKFERHQEHCDHPNHKGDRTVYTTWRRRKGKPFHCEDCQKPGKKQNGNPPAKPKAELKPELKVEPKAELKLGPKVEPKAELKPGPKVEPKAEPKVEPKAEVKPEPKIEPKAPEPTPIAIVDSPTLAGAVKRLLLEKGYGFITGKDGNDYHFHRADLQDVRLDELKPGFEVEFQIKRQSTVNKDGKAQAGAAQAVRRLADAAKIAAEAESLKTPAPKPESAKIAAEAEPIKTSEPKEEKRGKSQSNRRFPKAAAPSVGLKITPAILVKYGTTKVTLRIGEREEDLAFASLAGIGLGKAGELLRLDLAASEQVFSLNESQTPALADKNLSGAQRLKNLANIVHASGCRWLFCKDDKPVLRAFAKGSDFEAAVAQALKQDA